MNNLSIDIIIPAYNAEESIEKCILSIINQTYKNTSIIVVDDKSTDQTLKKLHELKNKYPSRITVLTQEKQGPSAARNLGLKHSKADFIGFVDADDYISNEMYSEMIAQIDEETDLVICGRYDIDKNDNQLIRLPNTKHDNTNIASNQQIISLTTTFIWDKIFRKSIMDKNKINFPEKIHYAEDCTFLTKFKLHTRKCKILAKPLYYHTIQNKHSITNTCNEKWLHIIDALEIINQYFIENKSFTKYQEQLCFLALGFYNRRVKALAIHSNKLIQLKFVFKMHRFLNKNFPEWKKISRRYNRLHTNKLAIILYTIIPNKIKPDLFTKSKALQNYILQKKYYKLSQQTMPIKPNKYLFISYSGSSISDSPLYIAKELKKDKSKIIYFASKDIKKDTAFCKESNLNFKIVSVYSLAYARLLATSKYITTNSRVPTFFNKRNNQILINTWHGTPLKTLGAGMQSGIRDIGRNQNQFLMSDYFLHPNIFTKEKISSDFCMDELYSGKHVLQGYPRNDPFFYKSDKKENIKKSLNLSNKKIFVYMPTWRGETINSINTETFKIELEALLKEIDNFLDDNTTLIVKLHQSLNLNNINESYTKIIFAPETHDIYEILCISDLLITDYSSIMFDYLYAGKPIILFIYDYQTYRKDRGFYIDAKDTPFPKAYNTQELIELIKKPPKHGIYKDYIDRFCLPYSLTFSKQSVVNIYSNPHQVVTDKQTNKYDIYFCDPCMNSLDESKILEIAAKKNRILVFHHLDLNSRTEALIAAHKNIMQPFVIAPEEINISLPESIIIKANKKYGLFKTTVEKIYKNELNRILPNIKHNKIYNLSKNSNFEKLTNNLSN